MADNVFKGTDIDAGGNTVLDVGNTGATNILNMRGAAATNRDITIMSGTSRRWAFRGRNDAESGSNAGTPLIVAAYSDSDVLIDNPITIVRASGGTIALGGSTSRQVTCEGDLAVNGGDLLTSAGTFNLINATPTTINFGGAGTTITIGATTGTCTIRNATLAATGGTVTVGADGTARGILNLWNGGGGNTPAYIRLSSPNGTEHYVFVEDDGTLKVHSAAPTQNSDGAVVGSQT